MMMTRVLPIIATTLLLAACGGGGGRHPPSLPTLSDAWIVPHAAVDMAASRTANSPPRFTNTGVLQSLQYRCHVGNCDRYRFHILCFHPLCS